MIIKPYSAIAAETFNAADFPALKHFWACKQGAVSAAGALLDKSGTANLTIDAGATASGNGVILPVAVHTTSGLTEIGGANCLFLVCGTWGATGSVSYGSAASGGFSVGTQAAGATFADGVGTKSTSGTQTASQAFTRVATVSSTSNVFQQGMMFETNSSTLDVYTNTVDMTAVTAMTSIDAVTQQATSTGSSHTIFGMAFFKFAGALPPKEIIQAAAAWCDYQWRNSTNVTMYPGFKGIA